MEIKFRKVTAAEVEVRIGSCSKEESKTQWCDLLLYKDARADMRLLDEAVGPMNWKREHKVIDGRLYCTVSIYNEETKEWVSKEDVGVESNTEKEKGQASDSFKRACVNWGPGRELYTAPHIRIWGGGRQTQARVSMLDYDDNGNITTLLIEGKKNAYDRNERDGVLFWMEKGVVKRVESVNAQTSRAVPPQAKPAAHAQVISDEVRGWADQCGNLNDLKTLQQSLIAQAMWNDGVKNYFNQLAKTRQWI